MIDHWIWRCPTFKKNKHTPKACTPLCNFWETSFGQGLCVAAQSSAPVCAHEMSWKQLCNTSHRWIMMDLWEILSLIFITVTVSQTVPWGLQEIILFPYPLLDVFFTKALPYGGTKVRYQIAGSRWNMLIKYSKNETPRWCIHWPPTGQTESTFLKEPTFDMFDFWETWNPRHWLKIPSGKLT